MSEINAQEVWFVLEALGNDLQQTLIKRVRPVIVLEIRNVGKNSEQILVADIVDGTFLKNHGLFEEKFDIPIKNCAAVDYLIKPLAIARVGHMNYIDREKFTELKGRVDDDNWQEIKAAKENYLKEQEDTYGEFLKRRLALNFANYSIKGDAPKLGTIKYQFSSAKELLKAKEDDIDKGYWAFNDCIFRGHSSEHYKLLPGVKRENDKSFLIEIKLLSALAEQLNRRGLFMPNGASLFPRPIDLLMTMDRWIPLNQLDFVAYAQHEGIETRMLDWTYDLKTAIWFAASGVVNKVWEILLPEVKKERQSTGVKELDNAQAMKIIKTCMDDLDKFKKDNGDMNVWAFNVQLWDEMTNPLKAGFYRKTYDEPLRIHTPYYGENNNARAQKGLLTYFILRNNDFNSSNLQKIINHWDYLSGKPEDNLPLDDYIADFVKRLLADGRAILFTVPFLYLFAIPCSEALEIYDRLRAESYKESSIYPTPENVAKEINSEMDYRLLYDAFHYLK